MNELVSEINLYCKLICEQSVWGNYMMYQFFLIVHFIFMMSYLIIDAVYKILKEKRASKSINFSEKQPRISVQEKWIMGFRLTILLLSIFALFILLIKKAMMNSSFFFFFGIIMIIALMCVAIVDFFKFITFPFEGYLSIEQLDKYAFSYAMFVIVIVFPNLAMRLILYLENWIGSKCELLQVFTMCIWIYINFLFLMISLLFFMKLSSEVVSAVIKKAKNSILFLLASKWYKKLCKIKTAINQITHIMPLVRLGKWKKSLWIKIILFPIAVLLEVVLMLAEFVINSIKVVGVYFIGGTVVPIFLIIKLIYKIINSFEDGKWLHIIQQIAGITGFMYLYFIIRCNAIVSDEIVQIYEFIGSVILIPYMWNKMIELKNMRKQIKPKS